MQIRFLFLLLLFPFAQPLISVPSSSLQAQAAPAAQDLVTLNDASAAPAEDFQDPALHPPGLKQTSAILLERAEYPAYSRELWHVQWRRGDPIDLYVILPKHVVKPPVVLYLYGFPSDTDRFLDDSYCVAVTSRGAAAVGFVSALTGARYHDRPWKEWFVSDLPEALGATAHDVQMILDFLEKRTDLNTQRMGIFGQGSGATIAALAASVDPRIRAVDLLDPWGAWDQWLKVSPVVPEAERATYLTPAFQASLRQLDPVSRLGALAPASVRLQQTRFNLDTPVDLQKVIAASMPSGSTIVRYSSVEDYKARAASNSMILEWITERLKQ